jgi:hypothetical protein
MLIVASVGLIVNLISMRILAGGKEDSLNVKGRLSRSLGRYARLAGRDCGGHRDLLHQTRLDRPGGRHCHRPVGAAAHMEAC